VELRDFLKKHSDIDWEEWYQEEHSNEDTFETWFFDCFYWRSPAVHIGSIYFGNGRYWAGYCIEVDDDRLVYIKTGGDYKQVKEYVSFAKDDARRAKEWYHNNYEKDKEWLVKLAYQLKGGEESGEV